jgi:hypothetical protein
LVFGSFADRARGPGVELLALKKPGWRILGLVRVKIV